MSLNLLQDSCGEAMMRLVIFVLNIAFFLVGIAFIGFGMFLEVEYTKFEHATDDKFATTPVGILVVGVFMLIVSSFGIWGVKRKSKCLTGLYGFALIIVIIAQLATIIAPIVAAEKSEEVLENTAFKTLSEWDGENGPISKSWDAIQTKLSCCGVVTYQDWQNSTTFQNYAKDENATAASPVPDSCCAQSSEGCGLKWNDVTDLNTEGCISAIESWVKSHIAAISGSLAIVGLTEFVAMVIAFHLVKGGFSYEQLA